MLHFTSISITTWFILLQYPPQHASLYSKIHHNLVLLLQYHNMLHFTGTCFTLQQYTPQPGSFTAISQHASFYWNTLHFTARYTTTWLFYCNITTCFILLEHASLYSKIHHNLVILLQYHNMLHFTGTCFISLEQRRHSAETGLESNQHVLNYLIIFKQRKEN